MRQENIPLSSRPLLISVSSWKQHFEKQQSSCRALAGKQRSELYCHLPGNNPQSCSRPAASTFPHHPTDVASACKPKSDKGIITVMVNFYVFKKKMFATGFPWALPHVSKRQLFVDKCIIGSWKELTLQTWHSGGILYEQGKGGSAKARARHNIKSINPAYWPYLSLNSITLECLMQKCHKQSLFYMHINVFFKYAIHLISAIPPSSDAKSKIMIISVIA